MNELNIILSAKKILSVNSLYNAMIVNKNGKNFPTIYKSREAKNVERWIGEQIKALDIPTNFPWITKDALFSYSINVIFKNGYLSRDLDNTLKLVQDGIFRALDINDSHVVQIFAKKSYMPGINEEKICISLRKFSNPEELQFNYIPTPKLIWTGDTRLSEVLNLKVLGKRKLKDHQYLVTEKEEADTKVYFVDSNEINYTTFGEIYLDLMENISSSTGLVFIGVKTDPNIDLEKQQAINNFCTKIAEMSNQYSGIQLRQVSAIKSMRDWIIKN